MALIAAFITMILLVALATALSLLTATETRVAGNYRAGLATLYAAEAAIEIAADDLLGALDWNAVLAGQATSAFVDGAPSGVRITAAGVIDVAAETNFVRCGKRSACTQSDLDAATGERPWGVNNPLWQVYASGPLGELLQIDPTTSDAYVIVWVGDDPSECDGRPDVDGAPCAAGDNRGARTVALLAHAYGLDGTERALEAIVARGPAPGGGRPRRAGILSWREAR
jgi:hypothetical protein